MCSVSMHNVLNVSYKIDVSKVVSCVITLVCYVQRINTLISDTVLNMSYKTDVNKVVSGLSNNTGLLCAAYQHTHQRQCVEHQSQDRCEEGGVLSLHLHLP